MSEGPPSSPAAYAGNVIAPVPGRCFRYVDGGLSSGYPGPCSEPVAWKGIVVRPDGRQVAVEACDRHASDLLKKRQQPETDVS